MVMDKHNHLYPNLAPWIPSPVQIPKDWMELFCKLSQEDKDSAEIYVMGFKYKTERIGIQLHAWGLPWQIVMAGFLIGSDEKQISAAHLNDTDEVLNHIQDTRRYVRDIDDENLPILLNPPYQNVGALLTAICIFYQAIETLREQHTSEIFTNIEPLRIQRYGRVLLNLTKRLGIWKLKRNIEDIIQQLRDPGVFAHEQQEYEFILKRDTPLLEEAQQLLMNFYHETTGNPIMVTYTACGIAGKKRRLQDAHTTATTQKTQLTGFDMVIFDIIVPTVEECYAALGVISQLGYIQDRVTDQIAQPKVNGYSYLALGLTLKSDSPYFQLCQAEPSVWQIQIATSLMQSIATYGCIHPICYQLYSQSSRKEDRTVLLAKQRWKSEEGSVLTTITTAFTPDHTQYHAETPIVVYDKNRRPVSLPNGATALDFAFTADQATAGHAIEAFINNRKASLNRELNSGDVIEIRTSREIQAQDYWLEQNYAKTQPVRRQIKDILNRRFLDRKAYEQLYPELARHDYRIKQDNLGRELRTLLERHQLGDLDAYLERLETDSATLEWTISEIQKQVAEHNEPSLEGRQRVKWIPIINMPLSAHRKFPYRRLFCRLCQPSYSQHIKIIGLLKEQTGELIVHKENCPQITDHPIHHREILLPLVWQLDPTYRVAFFLTAQDRRGLIFDITNQLRHHPCNLISINAAPVKDSQGQMHFTIETHTDAEALEIKRELNKIESVTAVEFDASATHIPIYERLKKLWQQGDTVRDRNPIELLWEETLERLPSRRPVLRNPFDISRPATAKMFFGRSDETKTMQRELCDGDNGKALILYGPRRSGKSSICKNFLERHVHPPFWHVLFSLQHATHSSQEVIFRQLIEAVCKKFSEQLQRPAPDWQSYSESEPRFIFKRLVQSCLAEVPDSRLVLALDEFGGALESYECHILEYQFFTFWKELMSEIPQMSLILALPTSSHNLLISGEFSNIFSFAEDLPVMFLDKESAQKLLVEPLKELHIAIHPHTVGWATQLTGENPYYMTLIGQHLLQFLNLDPTKQQIIDEDLQLVIDQLIDAGSNQNFVFHNREIQNPDELRILETLIELTEHTGQMTVQLKKIAAHLKLPTSIARRHLDRLRNGLILKEYDLQESNNASPNPHYSFRIELVRRWLAHNRWFFDALPNQR